MTTLGDAVFRFNCLHRLLQAFPFDGLFIPFCLVKSTAGRSLTIYILDRKNCRERDGEKTD
jgi:hypothetical protein